MFVNINKLAAFTVRKVLIPCSHLNSICVVPIGTVVHKDPTAPAFTRGAVAVENQIYEKVDHCIGLP